jgi:hypothetical protein
MLAITGVSVCLANEVILGQVENTKIAYLKRLHVGNSGCQTEVDGKPVQLQPGEGVHVGKEWRNCQTYDGHPVIIHSSEPPKSATEDAVK